MTAATALVGVYLSEFPDEAASTLAALPAAEVARVLSAHPIPTVAAVLRRLPVHIAADALAAGPRSERLLQALDPARAAQLVAALPAERARGLLSSVPERLAGELRELMAWPPGTAGALMDARVLTFAPDMTAGDALMRVREARDRRVADLVVADDGHFVGTLRLQDVVGAAPDQPLRLIGEPLPLSVHAMTPREDVVELLRDHRLASLPVVDMDDKVIGILRHDAMIRAAEQDVMAELQQAFGGRADERALVSPWVAVRSRHPWLQVNLVTAFVAAGVVGVFEHTIAQFTALAVLLPVVAGQSGNTGAQALAVTIRGLALREVRTSHGPAILRKEMAAGFLNGVLVALTAGTGVWLWSRNEVLAAITAAAMVSSMTMAAAAGAAIPLVLVALRRDPATASSIVLTTVTDVVGFASFLGLATLFLQALSQG